MRFSSKNPRNQHPQARLIPDLLWPEIFSDNSLSDSLISWMDMSSKKLLEKLTPVSDAEKDMAWIAIAFSHPGLDNQQLIEAGKKLGLSISKMLNLAVMLGDSQNHLNLLQSLTQNESYSDSLFKCYSSRIKKASKFGYLNTLHFVIEFIESKASDTLQEIIAANNFAAFRRAVEQGHLNVLKYLEKKHPIKCKK